MQKYLNSSYTNALSLRNSGLPYIVRMEKAISADSLNVYTRSSSVARSTALLSKAAFGFT